jgi:hypothetical protein
MRNLQVNIVGQGTVTTNATNPPATPNATINCSHLGGACITNYRDNTRVTLTAVPASGWRFSAWSGNTTTTSINYPATCNTSSPTGCEVNMGQDRSITATFVQVPTGWLQVGDSKVNNVQSVSVSRGDTVTFTHDVWNQGPNNMNTPFNSTVRWTTGSGAVVWRFGWGNTMTLPSTFVGHPANVVNQHIDTDGSVTGLQKRVNEFTIPDSAVAGSSYCQNISFTWQTNAGATPEGASNPACAVVSSSPPPPPPPSGNFRPVVIAGSYEKGSTTAPTVTFSIVIAGNRCTNGQVVSWRAVGPYADGVNPSRSASKSFSFTVDGSCRPIGTINTSASIPINYLNQQPVGNITYTTTIGSPISTSVNAALNVYEVPYAKFYGNDIYATSPSNGSIIFNTNTNLTNTDAGSAVDHASLAYLNATNVINTAAVRYRNSLTLPNALNSLRSWWQRTATTDRSPAEFIPSNPSAISTSTVQLNSLATGYYQRNGNLEIQSGAVINNKITTRSTGSTYISTNINTNVPSAVPGVPFNNATTPVVLIISDGDIYIDRNVTNIDAILVAQGGTIYSCSSSYSQVSRNTWHNQCNRKLVINGAVSAPTIRFARSIGTRLLANPGELPDQATATPPTSSASAAEVINFPGYLYFATPYLNNTSSASYQSIFNAPPLF